MHIEGREGEMMIQLATALRENERVQEALCDAFKELREVQSALAAARRETNGLRAYTDNLRGAADRLLQLWADYTSQEMYGKHLREGMGSDFTAWEEAHDYLRTTTNAARKALAAPAAAASISPTSPAAQGKKKGK